MTRLRGFIPRPLAGTIRIKDPITLLFKSGLEDRLERSDGEVLHGVLVTLYQENLEEVKRKISSSKGMVSKDIFLFPGGRRFHFVESAGNELAFWSD